MQHVRFYPEKVGLGQVFITDFRCPQQELSTNHSELLWTGNSSHLKKIRQYFPVVLLSKASFSHYLSRNSGKPRHLQGGVLHWWLLLICRSLYPAKWAPKVAKRKHQRKTAKPFLHYWYHIKWLLPLPTCCHLCLTAVTPYKRMRVHNLFAGLFQVSDSPSQPLMSPLRYWHRLWRQEKKKCLSWYYAEQSSSTAISRTGLIPLRQDGRYFEPILA